jgi:hypothetical protein
MNNIDATKLCQVSHILYNKTILELSKQINELKKENQKLKKKNEKYIFNDISGNLIPYHNVSIIGSYPEPTRSFRNNRI